MGRESCVLLCLCVSRHTTGYLSDPFIMSRALPRLYLGTMTFGWSQASVPVTEEVATEMALCARAAGVGLLDSARIYSGGATEPIVGAVLKNLGPDQMDVTTKAHP